MATIGRMRVLVPRGVLGGIRAQRVTQELRDQRVRRDLEIAELGARTQQDRARGGKARGAQISQAATAHDQDIRRHYKKWEASEYLQDDYRSAITYIKAKIPGLTRKKIERRLKTMKLRPRQ